MRYNVNVYDDNQQIMDGKDDCTITEARKTAKQLAAKYPNTDRHQVYVEWFRKSDGQHGYLNQDGNHEITGKAWEA